MTTLNDIQISTSLTVSPVTGDHLELSRLMAAAVVNPGFCSLLLVDPKQAIEDGYQGEHFNLDDEDRYLVLSTHADSLADLARQFVQALGLDLNRPSRSFAPAMNFISI